MNCSPLVSVRIPSYNHEKYIFECISSVLNQTYKNYEIVIVDDCSTDRTLEIIREFKDSRVKVDSLSINFGMNVAVEECMSSCNGEYIANMCSDDLWAPTKLEKQVLFLEQNKSYDAVFTGVEFIDEKGYTIKDSLNKYSHIFDCEKNHRQSD